MDLADSFLAEVSSDQTRRAYSTDLDRFFQKETVDEPAVQSVAATDVQSFLRTMHQRNLALSTQRRRLAALRRFFDWAVQEGLVPHNPARKPSIQLLETTETSSDDLILTKEDLELMIATAGESRRSAVRDQALILTIVYGALRRREIATLEVEDVRPLGRYWVLDLKESSQHGAYIRIPETVVEAIERVQDAYDITEGALWRSVSNQNRGQPMSPDAIYKVARRVSKQAGLKPVSIDTLRRAGLQLALQGGADLPKVQAHGRFGNPTSAAQLHGDTRAGALGESAVEYIDLDVSSALVDP